MSTQKEQLKRTTENLVEHLRACPEVAAAIDVGLLALANCKMTRPEATTAMRMALNELVEEAAVKRFGGKRQP